MSLDTEIFEPTNGNDWRRWLELNHNEKKSVWLIMHKKSSKTPNLQWSEAVDHALCYGWIDSIRRPIDEIKFKQYFTKRKAVSNWSKINKEKIQKLIASGLMQQAGLESIEVAKKNGSWTILDSVENLEIPNDLELEFSKAPTAKKYYTSLSKSIQKQMLYWIISAKRAETRQRRIKEIVQSAKLGKSPKQFIS